MPRGIKGSGTPIRSLTLKQIREFEKFTERPDFKLRLNRIVGWRARVSQKSNNHPFLGRDDLKAIALAAAFETYSKYVRVRKPAGKPRTEDSILALVVKGMTWAVLNEVKRTRRFGYDPREVTYAYLDAPSGGVTNADAHAEYADYPNEAVGAEEELAAQVGDPDILSVLIAEQDLAVYHSK